MITHLEPDIVECEVKRALGSITMNRANGGDRSPVELSQILEDELARLVGTEYATGEKWKIAPERMKMLRQSGNNAQLWM